MTHTLIGVGMGNGLFRRRLGREAVPILAVASNLPDVDVLVHLTGNPGAILMRRTFGHSMLLFPLWALLLALTFRRFYPRHRLGTLFGACLLSAGIHVFFDLINSFGVVLLWPLTDWRPELATVFIIDLVLTGLLAAPLLLAIPPRLRPRLPALSRASLGAVVLYVAFCGANRLLAGRALSVEAASRPRAPDWTYLFPEPLGPHRWRGVLREGTTYRVYLVHSPTGRIGLKKELVTQTGDPRVTEARETRRGRRLEWFFKAPVWRLEPTPAGAGGPPGNWSRVTVYDLRFTSLVLDRDPVFVFSFWVHLEGRVEAASRMAAAGPPRRGTGRRDRPGFPDPVSAVRADRRESPKLTGRSRG